MDLKQRILNGFIGREDLRPFEVNMSLSRRYEGSEVPYATITSQQNADTYFLYNDGTCRVYLHDVYAIHEMSVEQFALDMDEMIASWRED